MNPWYGKGVVLAATVAMIAIRAPHGHRSTSVPVAKSRKGPLETALLTLAWLGFFLPLLWVFFPWFAFADFPLEPIPFGVGTLLFVLGLRIFHRSHADLGTNWSITLEVREGHRLVTGGVYRRVRHPMYTGLLLYAVAQALVTPNAVAAPAYLVPMVLIVGARLGPEERMMEAEFGEEYAAYRARTKRLIPGVW